MKNQAALKERSEVFSRQGVSLYVQMADHLRHKIRAKTWDVGQKLPNMESLASAYGVARVTIRQAIKLLEDEGIVRSAQGKGTYVCKIPEDSPWMNMHASWDQVMYTIEDHHVEVLHSEMRDQCPVYEAFANIRFAPAYRYQQRLHSRGQMRFGLNHMFLAEDIYKKAPELLNAKPVVLELKALSPYPLAAAKQIMTITKADAPTAALLGIPPQDPLAEVHRLIVDTRGVLVYTCNIFYRYETVRMDVNIDI